MIWRYIKQLLSTFHIKLFLWFWFIALISIFGSRYITHLFAVDSSTIITTQTPHGGDKHQLNKVYQLTQKKSFANPKQLFNHIDQVAPYNIWLQNTELPKRIHSLYPLRPKQTKAIVNYLTKLQSTSIQTVLLPRLRVSGPISVSLNETKYNLYISRKSNKGPFRDFMHQLPTWVVVSIPIIISFSLCWVLARSLSRPLLSLKKATIKIAQGNYNTRVTSLAKRNDELGQLASGFNTMAEKLAHNISSQQRLMGDVSHELRSPLTRLQMALAMAQQASDDNQARTNYFSRCELEISRLDEMIGNVLTLSRLENTVQPLNCEYFNFITLLNNILLDEEIRLDEQGIHIEKNSPEKINVFADSALLNSAVGNVLSNAIKYSPKNSRINISVKHDHHKLTLVITDHGIGVPNEALANLFTAFYRVNTARDRKTGGTGLGLAIAKQAILAHHGRINAQNNASESGDGLSITIELPLKQELTT